MSKATNASISRSPAARQLRPGKSAAPRRSVAQSQPEGRLILLVGPEGRGKDMMVAAARRRFAADASFAFPPRVITRAQGPNDTHVAVTRRAFQAMQRERAFLVTWQAGDVGFGIPVQVADELAAGRTVVVAATHDAVAPSRDACRDVRVVEVLSGPDLTRARLAGIARSRGQQQSAAVCIEHPGDIAAAVRRFHDLLLGERATRLA